MKVPAVILCGGLGTRLRGLLGDRPKCLAPMGSRTYLDVFTDYLYRQGVENFIFATGYGHAHVEAWLQEGRRPWRYLLSREQEPLGTGGALRLAAQHVETKQLLAFNGDTFLDVDCRKLLARHQTGGCPVTLTAVEVADTAEFGRLEIIEGYVVRFLEKGQSGAGMINGGSYVIERSFIASWPAGSLSFEKQILMKPGFRAASFIASGRFLDIGTPESLSTSKKFLKELVESKKQKDNYL